MTHLLVQRQLWQGGRCSGLMWRAPVRWLSAVWGAPLLWGHQIQTPAGMGMGVGSEGFDSW